MPANGRWDLIRRLKVNKSDVCLLRSFIISSTVVTASFNSHTKKQLAVIDVYGGPSCSVGLMGGDLNVLGKTPLRRLLVGGGKRLRECGCLRIPHPPASLKIYFGALESYTVFGGVRCRQLPLSLNM